VGTTTKRTSSPALSAIEPEVIDAARLDLLRRRVVWFAASVGVVLIGLSLLSLLAVRGAGWRLRAPVLSPGVGGVVLIIVACTKLRARRGTMTLRQLVRRPMVIVIVMVVTQISASKITADAISQMMRQAGFQHVQIGALVPLLVSMFCVHLTASLILPWSLRESATPVGVIVAIALLASPLAPDPWPARLGGLLALALMGVPGMLICWLRYSRFRQSVALSFLAGRYRDVQRELATARRIHEKVFPRPIHSGPVHFDFRYEPMQQIGGDFVDAIQENPDDHGAQGLTIVLVDVTGHGIAAALAVNRLHGEIKRALAQQRSAQPGQILAALNEYVHLTLADENVFATALVARLDPIRRELRWASAGHPPAFLLRSATNSIDLLDSTAMLLGPLGAEEFDACEARTTLAEGDVLVAYTDGAIECRDRQDRELGIAGLKRMVAGAFAAPDASGSLDAVLRSIRSYRWGQADDDTLVLSATLAAAPAAAAVARGLQSPRRTADDSIAASAPPAATVAAPQEVR
jgi:serine phosphatase RsbU (regulator of sigma subunit)